MRGTLLTSVASVICAGPLAFASPTSKSSDLNTFLLEEGLRSIQGIADNLGPKGIKAPGTAAGLLVASPNTANPNCTFQLQFFAHMSCSDQDEQISIHGLATRLLLSNA